MASKKKMITKKFILKIKKNNRDFETKFLDLCRQVQQTKKRKSKTSTKKMSDSTITSSYEIIEEKEKIASLEKEKEKEKEKSPDKIASLEKVEEKEKFDDKVMPVVKKRRIYTKKNKQVIAVKVASLDNNDSASKKDINIPEESTKMAVTDERRSVALSNIESFKTNGLSFIESFSQSVLDDMIVIANDMYYNQGVDGKKPVMTDNEYDIVKEFTSSKISGSYTSNCHEKQAFNNNSRYR